VPSNINETFPKDNHTQAGKRLFTLSKDTKRWVHFHSKPTAIDWRYNKNTLISLAKQMNLDLIGIANDRMEVIDKTDLFQTDLEKGFIHITPDGMKLWETENTKSCLGKANEIPKQNTISIRVEPSFPGSVGSQNPLRTKRNPVNPKLIDLTSGEEKITSFQSKAEDLEEVQNLEELQNQLVEMAEKIFSDKPELLADMGIFKKSNAISQNRNLVDSTEEKKPKKRQKLE
jgi:hypothetical protein